MSLDDEELARLGRCEAQLRLRIGELLDALYAKRATLYDEEALIDQASRSTVREMQAKLTGREMSAVTGEPVEMSSIRGVSPEELLMVDASRMLVGYLSGSRASDEMLVTALLGEAETSLQSLAGARVEEIVLPQLDAAKIEAALQALRAARRSGEERSPSFLPISVEPIEEQPLPKSIRELDREIVRCCRELACRNLRIGRLADALFRSQAWRRLGFGSAEQYARERAGLSLSSLEHRATLARRVERCPALGEALERGEIGYEAALSIGRVLGPSSNSALVSAWIDRAKVRTYKHLREEIDAVLLGSNLDPTVSRMPPTHEDLEAVEGLERRVQSGEIFRSLLGARSLGPQTSVTLMPSGSVRPLRLTLPVELHVHWQKIESQFHAVAGRRASFVAFACFSLWSTWLPYLEAWDDKWIDVYRRDRHRCSSPVCERRDVTPHHLVFRRHGGGDERENVIAACAWCHLHGIHRGRLGAAGRAPDVRWTIGADPLFQVQGRDLVAAEI